MHAELASYIERENNFSGPAEWLEPDYHSGVERAVLYEALCIVQRIVSFLRDPSSGAARQLSGIGTWDAPIDAPTDATGQAEVLVGRWLRQIGVLDEVAAAVREYYRTPCPLLVQAVEDESWKDIDATREQRQVYRCLQLACERGDVYRARELVQRHRNAAGDNVAEFVLAWCDGREEDFYPPSMTDTWNGRF